MATASLPSFMVTLACILAMVLQPLKNLSMSLLQPQGDPDVFTLHGLPPFIACGLRNQ